MAFKKSTEIFPYICHFIFAIIIAISYETPAQLFIAPQTLFMDTKSIINAIEITLAYSVIISGWVGYSRSVIKWPHTDTKLGVLRFCLDIVILFFYYGLLVSTNQQNGFKDQFLVWLGLLFLFFLFWDLLKTREYLDKKGYTKRDLKRSLGITAFYLFLFIAISIGFDSFLQFEVGVIKGDITYMIILISIIAILLFYRYLKWTFPPRKRTLKNSNKDKD